jgi:hypothetical protein
MRGKMTEIDHGADLRPAPLTFKPTLRFITEHVCRYYGVDHVDLVSQRTDDAILWPRWVAMYLCRTLTGKSLTLIARRFNRADHTTARHGILKVQHRPELAGDLEELRHRIMSAAPIDGAMSTARTPFWHRPRLPVSKVGRSHCSPSWNGARVKRLQEMWAAGYSPAVIGNELGITRKAVRAKIDRMRRSHGRRTPVSAPCAQAETHQVA